MLHYSDLNSWNGLILKIKRKNVVLFYLTFIQLVDYKLFPNMKFIEQQNLISWKFK